VSDTASGVKAYVRQKEFDLTLPTDAVTVDGGPLMLNRRAVCLDIDSVEYAHTERTVEPVDFGRFMDSVKREPGAWDAACMREVREKRMVEWLLSHDWLQPEQNPEDPQIPGFFYAPLLRNVPLTRR
jgi:hypothetical protein